MSGGVSPVAPPPSAEQFGKRDRRSQLNEIVQRMRDGRLRMNIATIATLDDAVAVFRPSKIGRKTIIRNRP